MKEFNLQIIKSFGLYDIYLDGSWVCSRASFANIMDEVTRLVREWEEG